MFLLSHYLSIVLTLFSTLTLATQLAFPGAEGFGRNARGGREGNNCVVSTLSDEGPGSLRDCLKEPNRIVTFSIGGLIRIKSRMIIPKSTTILGQTAPSPGITVYGNGWSASGADDSIVRYIRIRMGKVGTDKKDALGIAHGKNIIFDHVSISWGRDETFSINGANATNITISSCIIGQGLESHSAGGLIQTGGGVSIFRNLYIDNKTRNPKVKGKNDYRNNVVYNWGGGGGYIAGGDSEGQSEAMIVGNYFISGPSTGSTSAFTRGNGNFHAYTQGNFYDADKDGTLNGKEIGNESKNYAGMDIVKTPFPYPGPSKPLSAKEALEHVLKDCGASKYRDAVDARMVAEVRSYGKIGELIHSEDEGPMAGLLGKLGKQEKRALGREDVEFWRDSDGDGVPDWYERIKGWDWERRDSMVIGNRGWTRLEEWGNWLV
jgi:hypothetical protein